MPYASRAQAGFFHTNPEKVGGAKVVKEFDEASKGMKLPARVKRYSGHNSPPYDKPNPTRQASDRGKQYPSAPKGPERPTKPKGDRSTQYTPKRDGNNYPAPAGDESLPGPRGAERSRTAGSTRQSLDPYPGDRPVLPPKSSGPFDAATRDIPRDIKAKKTLQSLRQGAKRPVPQKRPNAPASVGPPDNVPGRPTAGLVDHTTSQNAGSIRGSEQHSVPASERLRRLHKSGMISTRTARRMGARSDELEDDGDYSAFKSS